MWVKAVQWLDSRVRILADVHPELVPALEQLTASLGPPVRGEWLDYELQVGRWNELVRDGRALCVVQQPRDLLHVLEFDLHAQGARRARGIPLHAAAMARGGRAVVFAGPSGAGKTTLCVALMARGWRYLSDEAVSLDAAGRWVVGAPRPLSWPLGHERPVAPERCWSERAVQMASGEQRRVAWLVPPLGLLCQAPLPAAWLLLVHYEPGRAGIRRLDAAEALPRVWDCVQYQTSKILGFCNVLAGARHWYELVTDDLSDACQVIQGLVHDD